MPIKGGVTSNKNFVELSISISGGQSYKRIYNDAVSVAINKFVIMSTTLSKILITRVTPKDITFYINQIKGLFQRAHVEFISGEMEFQQKYNMWLLDGYVRMLLETTDMKLIAQLLDLDSILYSIEEAKLGTDEYDLIHTEFELPTNIKTILDIDENTELCIPVTNELSAYLHSFNTNLMTLTSLIIANKQVLSDIYKEIINTANKHLV